MKNLFIAIATLITPFFSTAQQTVFFHTDSAQVKMENAFVYRIQIRITTDIGSNMNADVPTWVQLNENDDKFFLVKGTDNYEKGRAVTYDIVSHAIRQVKDISFIKMGQPYGQWDTWGIKEIKLLINNNGNPVFEKRFSSPLLIDGHNDHAQNGKLIVASTELRQSKGWSISGANANILHIPQVMAREYVKSIAEATMGDYVGHHYREIAWAPGYYDTAVRLKPISNTAFQVEYFLEQRIQYVDNKTLHITVEIGMECRDNQLLMSVNKSRIEREQSKLDKILPAFLQDLWVKIGGGLKKFYGKLPTGAVLESHDPFLFFTDAFYRYNDNPGFIVPGVTTVECDNAVVLRDQSILFRSMTRKAQVGVLKPATVNNATTKNLK